MVCHMINMWALDFCKNNIYIYIIFMFSNYQWLLIGVIIACSCLVIYGSSSTSIKEGLSPNIEKYHRIDPHYKRCWNECTRAMMVAELVNQSESEQLLR